MTRGVIVPSINFCVITHSEELNVDEPSANFTSGFWELIARGYWVGKWVLDGVGGSCGQGHWPTPAKFTWTLWKQSVKDKQSITFCPWLLLFLSHFVIHPQSSHWASCYMHNEVDNAGWTVDTGQWYLYVLSVNLCCVQYLCSISHCNGLCLYTSHGMGSNLMLQKTQTDHCVLASFRSVLCIYYCFIAWLPLSTSVYWRQSNTIF